MLGFAPTNGTFKNAIISPFLQQNIRTKSPNVRGQACQSFQWLVRKRIEKANRLLEIENQLEHFRIKNNFSTTHRRKDILVY